MSVSVSSIAVTELIERIKRLHIINPKTSACFQCVFPEPSTEAPNTLSTGPLPVIGVTPGILGTLEASEVIKTALGLPNLENKLLMVNLLDLNFNKIEVVKDGNCICSK